MLLRELFDPQSAYQLEWRHGQARFLTADNREIRVSFHDQNLSSTSLVEITFSARVNDPGHGKSGTMGITGQGDAARIFGTVLQAIQDWLSQNHPEYIMFTADEPSRQKLYSHMVRRLARTYQMVTKQDFKRMDNDELPEPQPHVFLLRSRAAQDHDEVAKRENPVKQFAQHNNPTLRENLVVDVPNDDWLNDKREYVKSKGPDSFGVPRHYTTTAYTTKPVELPVDLLKRIPGARSEQSNVRHDDLKAIMHIMQTTGRLPQHNGRDYPPFIVVTYDGRPWVSEGNHRIMAAAKLGWDSLPVEIKYFEGGERVHGPLHPAKIGL